MWTSTAPLKQPKRAKTDLLVPSNTQMHKQWLNGAYASGQSKQLKRLWTRKPRSLHQNWEAVCHVMHIFRTCTKIAKSSNVQDFANWASFFVVMKLYLLPQLWSTQRSSVEPRQSQWLRWYVLLWNPRWWRTCSVCGPGSTVVERATTVRWYSTHDRRVQMS